MSNADADADANANANADADADADAGVTAIALPVLSYRRAKKCNHSNKNSMVVADNHTIGVWRSLNKTVRVDGALQLWPATHPGEGNRQTKTRVN